MAGAESYSHRMRATNLILGCVLVGALVACGEDPSTLRRGGGGNGYAYGDTSEDGSSSGQSSGSPSSSGGPRSSSSSGGSSGASSSGASSSSSSSSSGATSSSGSSGSTATTAEQICVDEINKYRATLGRPALQRWNTAEACSSTEAQSDSSTGRAHGAFGQCQEMAQNECPGWPGPSDKMVPSCLKMMWGEGPGGGHYENMASTRYTKVACGFYALPNGNVWSVQNFR